MFKESLVRELTPWHCVEAADRCPDNFTFPACCGSGVIFYGLDASGFQTFNCDLTAKHIPWFGTTADDLNIYHKRMNSSHMLFDDSLWPTGRMPLGYLTCDFRIDSYRLPHFEIMRRARDWQRLTDLRTGLVATRYCLRNQVRVVIEHVLPMGSVTPQFRLRVESLDGKSHEFGFTLHFKLRTRHGVQLWDEPPKCQAGPDGAFAIGARTLADGAWNAVEDYTACWGLRLAGGDHRIVEQGPRRTLRADIALHVAPGRPAATELALYVDNTPPMALQPDFDGALQASTEYWQAFFSRVADVDTGDDRQAFLWHRSQQLLASGLALDSGAPASFEFTSGCTHWAASSFHDATHVMLGLGTANMLPEARDLRDWMRDYAWQDGDRPIYWSIRYDGAPMGLIHNGRDEAYMATPVFAFSPIFHAAVAGVDRSALRMLRHVATWVLDALLEERADGRWYMRGTAVHDLHPDALEHPTTQDGFILCTLRAVLRKAADYAEVLGEDAEARERWRYVADHLYYPTDDRGYLLTADGGDPVGWPQRWIEFFRPAPQDPHFPDAQRRELIASDWGGQAWGTMIAATMGALWGHGQWAWERLAEAIARGAYGTGYFSEFFLEGMDSPHAHCLAHLPPFSTAHGAYLYALPAQIVEGSLWEAKLAIGPLADSPLAARAWSVARLRPLGGAVVTARGDAGSLAAEVAAPVAMEVHLRRPPKLAGRAVVVDQDGDRHEFAADAEARVTVPAGATVRLQLRSA